MWFGTNIFVLALETFFVIDSVPITISAQEKATRFCKLNCLWGGQMRKTVLEWTLTLAYLHLNLQIMEPRTGVMQLERDEHGEEASCKYANF